MVISNRGELLELINKWGIETYPVESKPDTKINNTIIYDKKKNRFYRIEWGEIADEHKVYHLWFNPTPEEVYLNKSKWEDGWHTKAEMKKMDIDNYKKIRGVDMTNFSLCNVENNIVDINEVEKLSFNKLKLVGSEVNKGKTWYAIKKTAEAIKNNEAVLFFSTDTRPEEITRRLVKYISETRIIYEIFGDDVEFESETDKVNKVSEFVNKSEIVIDNNILMEDNYIIDKMNKMHSNGKLNFVVLDSLQLALSDELNNTKDFARINNRLEDVANEIGCRVLITAQVNKDN